METPITDARLLATIYEIVTTIRERSRRTYIDALDLMRQYLGYDYSDDTFNKRFRRAALGKRGLPRYQQDEIEALIYAYTQDLTADKAFSPLEAIQLLDAARIPLPNWLTVKEFFSEEAFQQAINEYMQAHDIPELTPTEDLFYRLRPARHRLMLGRERDLKLVKSRLGVPDKAEQQAITVIRGWPGVGKTAFVNELVHDPSVVGTFADGILWMALGKNGNIFAALRQWIEQLGAIQLLQLDDGNLLNGLRNVLQGKDILLVADDVWTREIGIRLKSIVDPDTNTLLLTTRFTEVAQDIADEPSLNQIYVLDVLTEQYSRDLLLRLAPIAVQSNPTKIPHLIETLEGLPLALQVAGRLLHFQQSANLDVAPLIDELINNYNTLLSQGAPQRLDEETGQTPTIELLFKRSVQTLTPNGQMAFAGLGIFEHKPATFDISAIQDVIVQGSSREVILDLVGRGLLEATEDKRFLMHQTLHMYANKLVDYYDEQGELGL